MPRAQIAATALTLVVATAAALHGYEQLAKAASPKLTWFLWAMMPYALCVIVMFFSNSATPALLGSCVALGFDVLAHHDVFVDPRGSPAALALLFVPLWNTLIFAPAAMLISWAVIRRRGQLDRANVP